MPLTHLKGARAALARIAIAAGLSVGLLGCPSFGTPKIPCHSDDQCPTNYGCGSDGFCAEGAHSTPTTPKISSLNPTSVAAGSAEFALQISGSGFASDAKVNFGGDTLTPTAAAAAQLTVTVPAADVASAQTISVTVTNPTTNAGTSNAVSFTVTGTSTNPVPQLSAVTPSPVLSQTPLTLTLTGSGLGAFSTVTLDGQPLEVATASATQLVVNTPDGGSSGAARNATLQVTNPAPGGGSAQLSLEVDNPLPTLTSMTPNQAQEGATATAITLTGTGFRPDSVVMVGGTTPLNPTTYVSDTSLTAVIQASLLTSPGQLSITVHAPSPGGGDSNALTFTVLRPSPTLLTLNPNTAFLNGAGFTLEASGSGFDSTTQLFWDDAGLPTTVLDGGLLDATVDPTLLTTAGVHQITAVITGAAPSSAIGFTVGYEVPTITSATPDAVDAGSPQTDVTLGGTGFAVGATTAAIDGVTVPTDVFPDGGAVAHIPASELVNGRIASLTMTNPTPLGGTSTGFSFTVAWPPPVITSLTPNGVLQGSGDTPFTLTGENFQAGGTVTANGATIASTFVSSTSMTATIPAAMLVNAGPINIVVNTPGPGGGNSNVAVFTSLLAPADLFGISPTSTPAGSATFTLTADVGKCDTSCQLLWDDGGLTTTFVALPDGGQELDATVDATLVAVGGTHDVTVLLTGAAQSTPQTFDVDDPLPTLTSASPNTLPVGSAQTDVTLTGTGFITGQTAITLDGTAVLADVTSPTTIVAHVPATLLTTGRNALFVATNPAPGGGTSNALTFPITNLTPTITSVSPNTEPQGTADTVLTITGTNFVAGCIARADTNVLSTTVLSPTTLSATLPATLMLTYGTLNIVVNAPAPGGGDSNALPFTVTRPAATLTALSPTAALLNDPGFTLRVFGTGLDNAGTLFWDSTALATSPVSLPDGGLELDGTVGSGLLTSVGTHSITEQQSLSGTSNALTFAVNYPLPTLSSASPSSVLVNSAATDVTLTGTGFVSGVTTIALDGTSVTTTFNSSTSITAHVPASLLTTGRNASFTAANPTPGGGTSAGLNFPVNWRVPTLTALNPSSAGAGGSAFTLTLTGTDFASGATGATCSFGGTSLSATVTSSTSATCPVTAALIATAGSVTVTFTNPAPGGGTSNGLTFIIAPKINTIAGTGYIGHSASTAALGAIRRAAVAPSTSTSTFLPASQTYLADPDHNQIVRIDGTGVIQLVAGVGSCGFSGNGGAATSAQLCKPRAVAFDSSGNLYVADGNGTRLRLINATTGNISSVAGNGTCDNTGDGAAASSATLCDVEDLAVNSTGVYLVSGCSGSPATVAGNRVRVITGGNISTFAGTGTQSDTGDNGAPASATLNCPTSITFDGSGFLYIGEFAGARVRKVASNVITTFSSGTYTEVDGVAVFTQAGGGGGTFLGVADGATGKLYKAGTPPVLWAGSGSTTLSGSGVTATLAGLGATAGVFTDSGANLGFLSIPANGYSRGQIGSIIKSGSNFVTSITAGAFSLSSAPLSTELLTPGGIAVDSSGNLYFADTGHDQILKLTTGGVLSRYAGTGVRGDSADGLANASTLITQPGGLWMDASNNLYAVEDTGRVRKFPASGTASTVVSGLSTPAFVTGDASGNIFVSELGNHTVVEVPSGGGLTTLAGTGSCGYTADGSTASGNPLCSPAGLAIDANGDLWIADSGNHSVPRLHLTATAGTIGLIDTVAGSSSSGYSGDEGAATSALLTTPWGLSRAGADTLVTDLGVSVVRRIDASGNIHALAGNGTVGFSGDTGAAISAQLDSPAQAAGFGTTYYVADTQNDRIRQVGP